MLTTRSMTPDSPFAPAAADSATDSRRSRLLALIVATALLMENIDASVLATSLPEIAREFGANPLHIKLALTAYLLAMAIFIPASGWVADRFGARHVFRAAIIVFAAGSVACGMATSLPELVAARSLQGIGGAMMIPVARLIVLRATPKAGLVGAMAWLTVPALVGPVIGPPLGGFITTTFNWRWIFWINVPIAALGLILATIFIPRLQEARPRDFDLAGFCLMGLGLVSLLSGLTLAGTGLANPLLLSVMIAAGLTLLAGYVRHARRADAPLLDLRLLALPTFQKALVGGALFRIGIGALPFLLPLMFQFGFGYSPLQSGMLTFASGVGAIVMKTMAERLFSRFGFRRVLVVNAVLSAGLLLLPVLFTPQTPWLVMALCLFVGGLSRSLQFTGINTVIYADVPQSRLASATGLSSVVQELTGSVAVTVAAFTLETAQLALGSDHLMPVHFMVGLAVAACLATLSAFFFQQMVPDAGAALIARPALAPEQAAGKPPLP